MDRLAPLLDKLEGTVLAENETLDATSSPRWQRLCWAFRQGEGEVQLSKRLQKSLYGFVNRSITNITARGVKLDDLLHAATCCPRELPELLRRCRQHPFAQLIADNAAEGISRQELLLGVLDDLWEGLADQFGVEVVGCQAWPDYEGFREFLDDIHRNIQGELEHIASRLGENAAWTPRPPRSETIAAPVEAPLFDHLSANERVAAPADPGTEATRALLGESLLGNRRPAQ